MIRIRRRLVAGKGLKSQLSKPFQQTVKTLSKRSVYKKHGQNTGQDAIAGKIYLNARNYSAARIGARARTRNPGHGAPSSWAWCPISLGEMPHARRVHARRNAMPTGQPCAAGSTICRDACSHLECSNGSITRRRVFEEPVLSPSLLPQTILCFSIR
jgi:hypothetical protein